jgi:dihydrodipicolinate synthase/N-acetylneuraminate lyase
LAKLQVEGVVPPLVTPFTAEGKVYEKGLRRLLEFQIKKGIHGVFLCGTYGSGPLMSTEQRKRVVEVAVDQIQGRIAIVTQVGATSTEETVDLARHSEKVGADVIAAMPPYYYTYDEKAVLEHYKQLAKAVSIPVFAYNIPGTTGFTITPTLLVEMANFGVQGIKDSSFSLIDFINFIVELDDHKNFTFMIGTEKLLLPAVLLGAKGCVSGLSNIFPEVVVDLYDAVISKEYEKAAKLQLEVNKAGSVLQKARSPIAACYALLKERGIEIGVPKSPMLPITDDELSHMRKAYGNIGLLKP